MQREFNKALETAQALFDPDYSMRCQVFSCAFLKGRLIAVGRNQNKTHPLNLVNVWKFDNGEIHRDKKQCAELSLFLKLKKTTNIPFNRITIVNIRLDKHRNIKMSHPCPSCVNLEKFLSPKAFYYSNNSGQFERYS